MGARLKSVPLRRCRSAHGHCAARVPDYSSRIDTRTPPSDAAGTSGPTGLTQPRPSKVAPDVEIGTLAELAQALRELRRRHARRRGGAELTYRELAAATGWSRGIIGEYLAGRVLPPTDRLDALIRLLGAGPGEQRALATARDRIEEGRRAPAGAAPAVRIGVPRQLPVDVFGFTGRRDPLAALDGLLSGAQAGRSATIGVLAGTAGVGKTALAVHWSHRVSRHFPDGQLYVDLRGYDQDRPVPAGDALAGFLRGLGVAGAGLPPGVAERAAEYRTRLAGRRLLVVLDNAAGADHVRPLLPGSASCFVLVTSRDDLAGLVARDGARRIDLGTLAEDEALALLGALIGERVATEPQAARDLAGCCARLPLALRIAAEFATAHPGLPLAELVADLRDTQHRLDRLATAGDPRTAVRTVFSWSHRHLSAPGAAAFGLLGLHPGRQFEPYALAALAGTGLDQARAALGELAGAHLIERTGPEAGGWAMHDLLRAYAVEQAAGLDPVQAGQAVTRLLDSWVSGAAEAMDTLFPHEQGDRPRIPRPQLPAPALGSAAEASAWLDRQRPNLVAAALHAADHDRPRHAVELSRILWRHFEVGGWYQEALAVHSAAARAGELSGQVSAHVLSNLGGVQWWMGDYRQAREHFEQALAGHRQAGDAEGEARALARLGPVLERLGDYPAAVARLEAALALHRQAGNRHGEGAQLVNLGTLHRRLGQHEQAAEHQRRAAAIFAEIGDLRLEGYALGNLGAVENLRGHHAAALEHLQRALEHCRACADRGGEGSALGELGRALLGLGQYEQALEHLDRALAISRRTGDRGLEIETLSTLGETLSATGRGEAALQRYRAALELSSATGDRFEQARARQGLAAVLTGAGRQAEAAEHLREAERLYRSLGVVTGPGTAAR